MVVHFLYKNLQLLIVTKQHFEAQWILVSNHKRDKHTETENEAFSSLTFKPDVSAGLRSFIIYKKNDINVQCTAYVRAEFPSLSSTMESKY
jgi:hypothetical protein